MTSPAPTRPTLRLPGRSRLRYLGIALVGAGLLLALLAPWVAPYDADDGALDNALAPPAWQADGDTAHLLGTDLLGRDIVSQLLFGMRTSYLVALSSVGIALVLGLAAGVLAGYFGGRVDSVLMVVTDAAMSFPFIVIAVAIVGAAGPSLLNVILVISLALWPPLTRVARAEALNVRHRDCVRAARGFGASELYILRHHALPAVLGPTIVMATLQIAVAIVGEASLSFLGLGVPAPATSLGTMILEARGFLTNAWWWAAFPGVVISVSVLGWNLVGDQIRDAFDPRSATQ